MTLLERIAQADRARRRAERRESVLALLVVVPLFVIVIAGAVVSVVAWMVK
jgi:hypothetical protein